MSAQRGMPVRSVRACAFAPLSFFNSNIDSKILLEIRLEIARFGSTNIRIMIMVWEA